MRHRNRRRRHEHGRRPDGRAPTVLAAVKAVDDRGRDDRHRQRRSPAGRGQHGTSTPADVQAVMIGTTHFINALVEAPAAGADRGRAPRPARDPALPPVGGLAGRAGRGRLGPRLPRATAATSSTAAHLADSTRTRSRGTPHDMRPTASARWRSPRCSRPVNTEFEERGGRDHRCRSWAGRRRSRCPTRSAASACWSGRTRRSSTPALRELARPDRRRPGRRRWRGHGIAAPLYLSQNDGTLMDVDFAARYPVATFASGPTNSMRGAAFLSGLGRLRGRRHRRHDQRRRRPDQRLSRARRRPRSRSAGSAPTSGCPTCSPSASAAAATSSRDDRSAVGPRLGRLPPDRGGAGLRRLDADRHRHRGGRGPGRDRRPLARSPTWTATLVQAALDADRRARSPRPSTGCGRSAEPLPVVPVGGGSILAARRAARLRRRAPARPLRGGQRHRRRHRPGRRRGRPGLRDRPGPPRGGGARRGPPGGDRRRPSRGRRPGHRRRSSTSTRCRSPTCLGTPRGSG